MFHRSKPLRFATCALVGLAALLVFSFAPAGSVGTATAQTVSVEFRTALDPYGSWRPHDRWGEVWVPARVNRAWRPYTVGHWVYSDDYGWYWVAHEREARWGWVVYHYGRWVRDRELGWVWVPGREWAPAWVSWRRGGDHIGWAPLPPERLIVEYHDDPDVWIFVQGRRFTAPLIAEVVVPFDQQPTYFRQTVLVNRTVVVASGGPAFAVNPGIAPTIVSAVIGQPLTTYQVRPVVVAGTANIPNAVTVQASELQQGATQVAAKEVVQETQAKVEPAKEVPEPKPLAQNEKGRLGENPPKAAQQAAQQPAAETSGKTTAGQQGEQTGEKAAAQEKAGDAQDKAATQQQGEEPKAKSAAQEKSNAADDKAAAQQKTDEAKEDKAATQQKADEPKDKSAAQPANEAKDKAAAQRNQAEEAKDKATARQKQADDAKAATQRKQADDAKGKAAGQQRQADEPKAKSAAEKAAPKRSDESARGAAERAAPKQAQEPRPRPSEQAAPKAPAKPQTAGQGPQPAPKADAPAPRPQAAPESGPAQGQPKPKPER